MDTWENEGGALKEGTVGNRRMSSPAFFGRGPEVANRKTRASKVLSPRPIVWIAQVVGLGLLLLVLLKIFGFMA